MNTLWGIKPIIGNLENKIIENLSLTPNKTDTEVLITPVISSLDTKIPDTDQLVDIIVKNLTVLHLVACIIMITLDVWVFFI